MNLRRAFVSMALAVLAAAPFPLRAEQIALPDLNPAEWFDGKMGGTFGAKTVTAFAKSNRVAVAGFRVVFVTHNEARTVVRASYLPGTDVEFADMFHVDTKTGTVLSLTGADSKSRKFSNVAETTNEAYSAAADAVLAQATGAFAKLFAANPAK